MAITNVIKFTEEEPLLIWKWHDENYSKRRDEIRFGSQLIVAENQEAILVKGGKICDVFTTGQYTLTAENLPIVSQLFGAIFGGDSPFQISVYFINKSIFMNAKFGIPPFNLIEPNFKVPIPVSARGTYAIRIKDGKNLLINLAGNITDFTVENLRNYFRSLVCTKVKKEIIEISRQKNISPIELETQIDEVNQSVNRPILNLFSEYGLELKHFVIEAIPVIDDDQKVKDVVSRLHELMSKDIEEKMKFRRHAENLEMYKTERMYDTALAAAENLGSNGIAGAFVGLNAAQPLGNMLGAMMNTSLSGRNNQSAKQQDSYSDGIKCDKCGAVSPFGTKFCVKCGDPFIVCPNCKKDNPSQTKFCIFCGSPMKLVCKNCGTEYTAGAVFCGECGQKLN